jgi:hypothetical protein
MIAAIESHTKVQNHQMFFDNFFTSYQLLNELAGKDIRATGTTITINTY